MSKLIRINSSSSDDHENKNMISTCSRGHWRIAEDDKLKQLVEKHGPQNWNLIAEKLEGRSGKSCRLRWYNQLDPRITKKPFTQGEEERLLQAHKLHGNKWASIARFFPGRTDNAIKNHYHVIMARRKRDHHHRHHHSHRKSCLRSCMKNPNRALASCDGSDEEMMMVSSCSFVDDHDRGQKSAHRVVQVHREGDKSKSLIERREDLHFIDFLGVGIS